MMKDKSTKIASSFLKAGNTYHKEALAQQKSGQILLSQLEGEFIELLENISNRGQDTLNIADLGSGYAGDLSLSLLGRIFASQKVAQDKDKDKDNNDKERKESEVIFADRKDLRKIIFTSSLTTINFFLLDLIPTNFELLSQKITSLLPEAKLKLSSSSLTMSLNSQELVFNFIPKVGDVRETITEFPAQSLDMVISNCMLQWIADPSELFKDLSLKLKSKGLFYFSACSTNNFKELKASGLPSLSYLDLSSYQEKVKTSGLQILNSASQEYQYYFASFFKLLSHLKETGVNALPPSKLLNTRSKIKAFATNYEENYNKEGLCYLTYHFVQIGCRK